MTAEQIKKIIVNGENSSVEFKRCGNGMESDVYETVCSFSNRLGGYIFVEFLMMDPYMDFLKKPLQR